MQSPERVNKIALVMWLLGLLSYAMAVINRSSFAALGPIAQDHFGVEAAVLGSFAVMQLILYVSMQIPVGILVHRFGPTVVIVTGGLLMALGQALLAVAGDIWVVVLARVLVGIGDALTFVSVLRLQAHWFPVRQLPIWTQVTSQLGMAGQVVSVLPLALLVTTAGWTTGFLSVAGATLLLSLASIVLLKDSPLRKSLFVRVMSAGRRNRRTTDTGTIRTGSVFSDMAAQFRQLPQLLRIPGVRLAFWVHFTTPFSAGVTLMLWGYPFLTGGVGLDRSTASSLLILTVLASVIIGLMLGPISARFYTFRVQLVVGSIVLIALSWLAVLLWPGTPPLWLLIELMIAVALGSPMSMISFDIARAFTPPRQISLATGFVNTGGFISLIFTLFAVGIGLDLLDAGSPETYNLPDFRLAMAAQFACWIIGLAFILRESRLAKATQAIS